MGLDLWFEEDVKRILESTLFSAVAHSRNTAADPEAARNYRLGFVDAVTIVGRAFGIKIEDQIPAILVFSDSKRPSRIEYIKEG